MPTAHLGKSTKYHFQDHDPAYLNQVPPDKDTWYTVLEDTDVRLIQFAVYQNNDEVAAKDIEVKWTLDTHVYFIALDGFEADEQLNLKKDKHPSTGGTAGLGYQTYTGAIPHDMDKRAHSAKLEVRMTSAAGTNQVLRAWCLYETLEET